MLEIPVAKALIPNTEITADYAALAKKVGFTPTPLSESNIAGRLGKLGLREYDAEAVEAYLNEQYADKRGWFARRFDHKDLFWIWRPLREADRNQDRWLTRNGEICWHVEPYDKPVPYPVLLTVENILDVFPRANFFVSDEVRDADRISDPFLMTVIGKLQFIVERWDEPKFRG